jgi:hypothetical protein
MSKEEYVKLQAVIAALQQTGSDQETIDEILDLLSANTVAVDETAKPEDALTEATDETEGSDEPKVKKQYVMLVSDPNGVINKDLTGWVIQMPEDEDVRDVVNCLKKGAYNFNASKKGQKYPVSSIGQAIANVGNKFFKPYNVSIKTKEPILIVTTDNKLPRE